MNIYLAARYSRHSEMAEVADLLQERGFRVTSRWIRGNHDMDHKRIKDDDRERFAIEDMEDIAKSDCIVLFTEDPKNQDGKPPSKGGHHVEFGVGVALNKRMVIVGPRVNVFHHLPNVEVYGDLEEFLEVLEEEFGD